MKEYADERRESETAVYRLLDEFRDLFTSEDDPSRILEMLWSGMPRTGELMALLDVRVIDAEHS